MTRSAAIPRRAADAETDLIRRIGRRRIVRLPSIAYSVPSRRDT